MHGEKYAFVFGKFQTLRYWLQSIIKLTVLIGIFALLSMDIIGSNVGYSIYRILNGYFYSKSIEYKKQMPSGYHIEHEMVRQFDMDKIL